ncbi:MAG: DnaJ domain-containing protein [Longibaculum sp.]
MRKDIWNILGIEPTSDKKAIKKAYAFKGKDCHPEEHPEAFQELQQAYKKALAYASLNKDISNQTVSYQSTYKDDSQSMKSSSKDYQIHVQPEELEPFVESQVQSFDVDLDILEQSVLKKSNQLFNDKNGDDFQDNYEYQDYLFESFIKQMGKKINEDKLQSFIENTNLLMQCYDEDFCMKVDQYLSNCQFQLKRQRYAYWIQMMKKFNFLKTVSKLEKLKKKKDSLPKSFYFMMIICIALGFIFGSTNQKKKTPKYPQVIDKSKLQIINPQAQIKNAEYQTNRLYINGVTLIENEEGYILKDKNGKVIDDKISNVYFTNSEVIFYQKNKFVFLNTKTMKTIKKSFEAARVVSVEKDGKKQLQKMIVASYDGVYWKLFDLNGDVIVDIEEKCKKEDIPYKIYIKEGKATFQK